LVQQGIANETDWFKVQLSKESSELTMAAMPTALRGTAYLRNITQLEIRARGGLGAMELVQGFGSASEPREPRIGLI